jgi:hypothetical protein
MEIIEETYNSDDDEEAWLDAENIPWMETIKRKF